MSCVDTLLDLEFPGEKRRLEDGEMISSCMKFLKLEDTLLVWGNDSFPLFCSQIGMEF
jgi:hypothetical protein